LFEAMNNSGLIYLFSSKGTSISLSFLILQNLYESLMKIN